jgi:hypothetical protein
MSESTPVSEFRAFMDPVFSGIILEGFLCGISIPVSASALKAYILNRNVHPNSCSGNMYVSINFLFYHLCKKDVFMITILGKLGRKVNKGAYSLALILLWMTVIGSLASDWILDKAGFIINNGSPVAIYNALNASSRESCLWLFLMVY